MALVILHHSVTTIVDNYQRLFVGIHVAIDLSLVPHKDLFDFGHAEVLLLNDVHILVESVLLDVSVKNFHVFLDFREVCEAFFFGVTLLVYSYEADCSVVVVAKDEALTFVWAKVGHDGFLNFTKH